MDSPSLKFLIWATALGAFSAVSLPLGSVVALRTNPRPQLISMLAAFGAGALVAALSVELVAPTVFAMHHDLGGSHHGDPFANFLSLLGGAVLGGLLFAVLDQVVNAHGGFLRKTATSIAHFNAAERQRQRQLLEKLSHWPLLQHIPPDHANQLVAMVRPRKFHDGEILGKQGEDGRSLFFVMEGNIGMTRDGSPLTEVGPNQVVGIVPLLAQIPNPATATAKGPVTALELSKDDLELIRKLSPEFDRTCRELTGERLAQLEQLVTARHQEAVTWAKEASHAIQTGNRIPDAAQLRRAKEAHSGAPLAIWLGILIDGIPESFVIGSGLFLLLQDRAEMASHPEFLQVIPYTLIAGLFLSNFPEALASSATMRIQAWSKRSIFLMWFSLMAITAVGAGLGYLLASGLDPRWLVFAEGLAAGAMLTMIASSMIPEAVHMGNSSVVGLSTLAGFIAAISFTLLE
jgi:CRP-like cAMP-binding protein